MAQRQPGRIVLALHGAGYAGTERHVRSLATGLNLRGWNVELVSSLEGPLLDSAGRAGVPTHLVSRTSTASYLTGLIRVFRKLRPALVHAHSGLLPGLAARWAGVRVVVETRHGLPGRLGEIPGRSAAVRTGDRWSWRLADQTLTVCAADADWLIRNLGMPAERITVVPNGLPHRTMDPRETASARKALRDDWGVGEEGTVLGFIGRLREEKAPQRLLDLLAWLHDRKSITPCSCLLVVAGDGPDAQWLRDQAASLGLDPLIRWLGVVPEASRILPGIDHLLLPSLYEGMPYVVIEALQVGVPVTATPVGGLPEVLEGPVLREGLVPWSAEAWGGRVLALRTESGNRLSWREAAMSRAALFDEERMLDQVETVYSKLIP